MQNEKWGGIRRGNHSGSASVSFENRRNDSRKGAKIAKINENSIGKEIVDAAIAIHRELGPGLLETVCQNERFLGDLGGLTRENKFEQVTSADGVPPLNSVVVVVSVAAAERLS